MKIKSLEIILISFIAFILNSIVFFMMAQHMQTHNDFTSQFMYYLSVGIMLVSGLMSYVGYRDLTHVSKYKKITAHTLFYLHMLGIGLFLGTILFSLT